MRALVVAYTGALIAAVIFLGGRFMALRWPVRLAIASAAVGTGIGLVILTHVVSP